jgi:hypothetical protein
MANHKAVDFLGQRLDSFFECVALVREGEVGTMIAARASNTPGDRAIIRDAQDQPAFATHKT